MFIILDGRFGRGLMPWLTPLLILVNSFVFLAIKGDDDRYRVEAFGYSLTAPAPG